MEQGFGKEGRTIRRRAMIVECSQALGYDVTHTPVDEKGVRRANARGSQAHDGRVQNRRRGRGKGRCRRSNRRRSRRRGGRAAAGEGSRTQRVGSTKAEQEATTAVFSMVGQSQKVIADGISRWTALAAPFAAGDGSTELFGSFFDPRHLTQEAFRLAEELVALQKEYALKVVDLITPAPAA
jgi:hypothetical protein